MLALLFMVYFVGSHSLYTPPIPSRAVSAPPPPIFVAATSYGPTTPVRAPVTPPTPPLSSIGPSPDQLLRGIIPFPPISIGPFSVPAGIAAAPPPSNFFSSEHPTPPQPFSIPAGIAAAPPPSNLFPSERPTSQQPFSVPAGIAAAPPPSNFFPSEHPTPPQPFSIPAGIAAAPPPSNLFPSERPTSQQPYSVPAGIAAAPPPSNFLTLVSPPPIRAQSAPTGITLAPPKELVLSPGSRIEIRDELGQYSHGFSDQNGTTVSEQGRLTLTNEGWESVIVKEGSYSYVSPEGIPVSVSYIADEKGFRATGSHLPNVVLVKGR